MKDGATITSNPKEKAIGFSRRDGPRQQAAGRVPRFVHNGQQPRLPSAKSGQPPQGAKYLTPKIPAASLIRAAKNPAIRDQLAVGIFSSGNRRLRAFLPQNLGLVQ